MVKIGKAFSIFVVLTLLILLAPAVVLTGGGVALGNGEAVTEEIEASFSFSVDSSGAWHTFDAGSGTVQAGSSGSPRLGLVQYTRPNVVIPGTSARVNGCGFREYTTGSGTVTSTVGNMTGTLTLEWIAVRFNMAYTHTPKYLTTTDFGWMMARGCYYDEGNSDNNFTFVFIADLDCNDDMTVAAGKGVLESVEENGRFGNMTDPIEDRHHIMGDFDIALSGGTYTGNFHLRNYPSNEVYNEGVLNVSGGVMQEFTDDINPVLEIMNVTSDGPMSTPYDEAQQPGFEEIDWGKDPMKVITYSDRLGANATMDLTRNSALYLNQSMSGGTTYITIQANPACILHIDDTYNVTGDDGTPYGELYEILLLSLPLQKLALGNYFNQTGYTFCPFGTINGQPTSATDLYEGTESFADATIYIESSVGNSLQHSTDVTYGLFAHPKVESVYPSNGFPGTTMNVKIYGKYFLRVAGQKSGGVPNSGELDFGPNITINSYTIDDPHNPIDNSITANITIAGGAGAGAQVVNVSACFGYSSGNGAAPYKYGTGVFNVVTTGGTLNGTVTFVGRVAPPSPRLVETYVVKGFEPGNLDFEVWNSTATTNESGVFTISGILPETYDIGIKNATCLSEIATNVTISSPGEASFGNREGDVKETDKVDGFDFALLSGAYNSRPGDVNWNRNADLNISGKVDGFDFSLLSGNYNVRGSGFGYFV